MFSRFFSIALRFFDDTSIFSFFSKFFNIFSHFLPENSRTSKQVYLTPGYRQRKAKGMDAGTNDKKLT